MKIGIVGSRLQLFSLYGISFTLAFSLLNLNSIFIILLALGWLLEGKFRDKWGLLRRNLIFFAYVSYFLILVPGIINADPISKGWKYLEGELGFLILPLLLCSTTLEQNVLKKIIIAFLLFLTSATLYCLVNRMMEFGRTGEVDIFFYHNLLKPIDHHAVYFSVFLLTGTIFLVKEAKAASLGIHKGVKVVWIIYCIMLLILLSSKMVLLFLLAYIIYSALSNQIKGLKAWHKLSGVALILSIVIALFTFSNPVKKRFRDIITPNTELQKEKFDRATYFNGIEFRLLLWRITYEILEDNKAWPLGVGVVNAQSHLNQKYLQLDLYAGNDGKSDSGYLVYNCHNQFLQTSLQSGMLGLAALLFLCVTLVLNAFRKRNEVLICTIALLFCFLLIESVFERQYGVLLSTWLPLLFFIALSQRKETTYS
ncbi:MAG TPA: O-antigen ligase family protein [Chitinophagaceae bacterium]|nr:O-antigen ligase family protein [Chitinophagaceae bacterium]